MKPRLWFFKDVTFDDSVPFYRLFPYRSAPPPPPPTFLAPGPPLVDPLPPQGPPSSGVSKLDPRLGTALVKVAVGSSAAPGAASGGAASEPRGAEPEGVEPGGAESEGAESGGAEPRGAASSKAHEAGGVGDAGAGGAGVPAGAVGAGGTTAAGPGDPTEHGASGAGGSCTAIDPRAGGAGGTVWPQPYFVPLLQQVFGVPSSTGLTPPLLCPPPGQSQPPLQPASPLPAPSPYTEQYGGLTGRREPLSHPVLPVRTARRAPRSCLPPVPGTHAMALRSFSVPLHVPLPAPLESSLPEVPDP
ncbi:unnamed protein product [Closterium sp. NIES-54]